jgi:hypothetical protein
MQWSVSEKTDATSTEEGPRERRSEPRSGSRAPAKANRLTTRTLALPWLCFESARETRRLSAVPSRWEELPEDELEDLLSDAKLI